MKEVFLEELAKIVACVENIPDGSDVVIKNQFYDVVVDWDFFDSKDGYFLNLAERLAEDEEEVGNLDEKKACSAGTEQDR